jgi:outer membrane protein OmpA-like peptidoglycan-associated protein
MRRLAVSVFVASLLWILAVPADAEDTVQRPDQGATTLGTKPAIDLAFEFHDGDSVETLGRHPQVVALGKALSDPGLKNATFVIACHVKVPGSAEHNLELSERCASLVRQVLIEQHGLRPQALVAVGYGESKLKNPENPMAAENQRLQVVNMGDEPD